MSFHTRLTIIAVWVMLVTPAGAQNALRVADSAAPGSATRGAEGVSAPASEDPAATRISNAPRSVSAPDTGPLVGRQGGAGRAVTGDSGEAPMPLPPRSERQRRQMDASSGTSSGRALLTVVSSLAVVLAVFFAFVWITRSAAPKGMAPLAKEVVESLGRAPLLGRQQMQLIRIGNKLVLLSVTPTGADALTEITDPEEVDRLAGLCRQGQAGSITESFRQVLNQATAEPDPASTTTRARQTHRTGTRGAYRA